MGNTKDQVKKKTRQTLERVVMNAVRMSARVSGGKIIYVDRTEMGQRLSF